MARAQARIRKKFKPIRRSTIGEGSGNVSADIGVQDPETMRIKAQLVAKIAAIIVQKGLTQTDSVERLGMSQPKVFGMLKSNFRGISERRLMDCLTQLGSDVQVVVKPAPRHRRRGKLSVVFA